jgi:hypothetical protein
MKSFSLDHTAIIGRIDTHPAMDRLFPPGIHHVQNKPEYRVPNEREAQHGSHAS